MYTQTIFIFWLLFGLATTCTPETQSVIDDHDDDDNGTEIINPALVDTLVIMPLGDSLTNDSRPRVTLWNLLTDDDHDVNYVGDQYQASSIPEPYHEGVGGIKIQGIIEKTELLMQTHEPTYVTLMVGTNDIAWYFDETAAEIAARWNELIQLIFDSSEPGTYIIASTIPPVTSKMVGKEDLEERDRSVIVQQYNSALRNHISNRRDNGQNIILADVEEELDMALHLSNDGVHLNGDGYTVMGTVYYEAIFEALLEQQ